MSKVIIAGCRWFTDYELAKEKLDLFLKNLTDIEIICGTPKPEKQEEYIGADQQGERYALEHGLRIKYISAEWNKYGRKAGPMRNRDMAVYATGNYLVAFWDGRSRGTKNMINLAKQYKIKTKIVQIYAKTNSTTN